MTKMADDLRTAWLKWAMESYTFKQIQLSKADLEPLSAGAKEEGYTPVDDGSGAMVADALKYFYQQKPDKPGDKVKPLTNDQKHKNTLYLRELKKFWKKCKEQLQEQVKEIAEGRETIKPSKKPASSSSGAEAKGTDRADGEKKSKGEGGGSATARSEAPSEAASAAPTLSGARLELKILNDLSLKRLREWVEEDEDSAIAEQARRAKEKRDDAKKQHESFVKAQEEKDEQRRREKRRQEAEERERKREEEERTAALQKDSFEKWAIQKEIRESALRCLALLPSPLPSSAAASSSDRTLITASTARRSIVSSTGAAGAEVNLQTLQALKDSEEGSEIVEHAMTVGRALKKIDRTLLPDWARWCDKVIPFNTANVFWDAFEPMACDVHSAVTSSVKDAFLKVLRPGVDYQAAFTEYAARMMRRGGDDPDRMDKEEKDRAMSEIAIPKNQMVGLLQELGLSLKPTEVRTLIDSFDANGDGKITVGEFKDFCVMGRAGLTGSSRCCWSTTCSCTGMPNAYSISEPTQKQLRGLEAGGSLAGNAEAKDTSSRSELGSKMADNAELVKIVNRNGEKRIIVELKDRNKREKLCRAFGVISSDTQPGSPDGYGDDDFDEYDGDADAKGSGAGRRGSSEVVKVYKNADRGQGSPCSFSLWTNEDRRKGLEVLYAVSRVYRQEEMIRNMLTQGQPPKAPRFWVDMRAAGPRSSFELDICWEPSKGDLVSFFCVEYSGPVGTGRESSYREVFRDPPTADPNEQLQFGCKFPQDAERFGLKLDKLQPGTSYQFRVRAFNGFGPGDYSYKVFTTRPDAPPAPRIQKLSSDSVTLRWTFSETFFKRLQDLRKLFDAADGDKTGVVCRDELVRALDERDSPSLRSFLEKRAVSLGVDLSQGYGALFDQIDVDDGGTLSWTEFEDFFVGAGWADSKMSASMGLGASASQSMMRGSAASLSASGAGSRTAAGKQEVTYVVEQVSCLFSLFIFPFCFLGIPLPVPVLCSCYNQSHPFPFRAAFLTFSQP